jgi:hypothetical protein
MIRVFNIDKSLDKYYMDVNSLDFMSTYNDSYISGSSIIITKETEGEDSSTFQVLTIPKKDGSRINIMVLIDDEPVRKSRFFGLHESENIAPTEVFQELRNWGPDVPADFKRKIGDHLGRNLRVSRDTIEAELGFQFEVPGVGGGGARVRGERKVE